MATITPRLFALPLLVLPYSKGIFFMRCFVILFALLMSACAAPLGASLTAEEAAHQRAEIQKALHHALALHAQGYTHDAQTQWALARDAYNDGLKAGIAFHHSPQEALRISVLLGQIAADLSEKTTTPETRITTLSHTVTTALKHIPSATPDPVILARTMNVEGEGAQKTALLQMETDHYTDR